MRTLFILLISTFLYASSTIIDINSRKYKLIEEEYNEYGEKGLLLNFYTLKRDKLALSFLLSQRFGGCGKRNYEESTYTIDGVEVIIYTKWSGYSIDGYRKMVYSFDKNSTKAKRIFCKLYIENRNSDDKDSGVIYLNKNPRTQKEKQLLDEYIHSIENIYKGDFVLDEVAKELSYEVEKALKKSISDRWGK